VPPTATQPDTRPESQREHGDHDLQSQQEERKEEVDEPKRPFQEKQSAFIEFKSTSEGQQIENHIIRLRQGIKDDRQQIKNITHELNSTK